MQQRQLTLQQIIGIGIFTLLGPCLALFYWFRVGVSGWPLPLLYTIAAFGGALGMAFYAPQQVRVPGIFCGILMGLGSFGLQLHYSAFRATMHSYERMYNYESLLVTMVGAAPGMLIFRAVKRRKLRQIVAQSEPNDSQVAQVIEELQEPQYFASRVELAPQLKSGLVFLGFCFGGPLLLVFALMLLPATYADFRSALATPECRVVTYAQFVKEMPHVSWYQIKNCRVDLREAYVQVNPPGHTEKSEYAYLPIHADGSVKEKYTQLVVYVSEHSDPTLWKQLKEMALANSTAASTGAEVPILNAHQNFVL